MACGTPSQANREEREGDIMVTAVARHFAIGRLNADCTIQTHIEAHLSREVGLTRARILAGANHRVFLCAMAGKVSIYHPVHSATPPT